MKHNIKKFRLLFFVFVAFTCVMFYKSDTYAAVNYKKIYKSFLTSKHTELMNKNDSFFLGVQSAKFALVNIDGKGSPELILANGSFSLQGAPHYEIYTIANGKVKKMGYISSKLIPCFSKKEKTITFGNFYITGDYYETYKVKGTSLKCYTYFSKTRTFNSKNNKYTTSYSCKHKKISSSKYKSLTKKYCAKAISFKALTNANINAI